MGTQHPGDLRMQEGPLSSNDLKTGSISQKVFPSEAGDRSVHLQLHRLCVGDSPDTAALGAHLHEEVFFLPSVRSGPGRLPGPRCESIWGTFLPVFVLHRLVQPLSSFRGGKSSSLSSCRIPSVTTKHLLPRAFLGSLECICAQRGPRNDGR